MTSNALTVEDAPDPMADGRRTPAPVAPALAPVPEATPELEPEPTSGKRSKEEQLIAHRRHVKVSAEARKAALRRLIAAHEREFAEYLEEEKAERGIRTHRARRTVRQQEEHLRAALRNNPDLVAALRRDPSLLVEVVTTLKR